MTHDAVSETASSTRDMKYMTLAMVARPSTGRPIGSRLMARPVDSDAARASQPAPAIRARSTPAHVMRGCSMRPIMTRPTDTPATTGQPPPPGRGRTCHRPHHRRGVAGHDRGVLVLPDGREHDAQQERHRGDHQVQHPAQEVAAS